MKQPPSSLLPLANSPVHFSSPGEHQKAPREDQFYPNLFYSRLLADFTAEFLFPCSWWQCFAITFVPLLVPKFSSNFLDWNRRQHRHATEKFAGAVPETLTVLLAMTVRKSIITLTQSTSKPSLNYPQLVGLTSQHLWTWWHPREFQTRTLQSNTFFLPLTALKMACAAWSHLHAETCDIHRHIRVFFLKVSIDNTQNEDLRIWCKQCRVFTKSFHKLQIRKCGSFITSAGQQVSAEQKCTYKPFCPIQSFSRCQPMHSLSDLGEEERWWKAFIKKKTYSFMASTVKNWY